VVGLIRDGDLVLRSDMPLGFPLNRDVEGVSLGEELVQAEGEQRAVVVRMFRGRAGQQGGADGSGALVHGAAGLAGQPRSGVAHPGRTLPNDPVGALLDRQPECRLNP
jgi:hypothetical protein